MKRPNEFFLPALSRLHIRRTCAVAAVALVGCAAQVEPAEGGSTGALQGSSSTASTDASDEASMPGESSDSTDESAGSTGDCQVDCDVCGNGVTEGQEQCDDGNGVDHDGCNNDCSVSGAVLDAKLIDHRPWDVESVPGFGFAVAGTIGDRAEGLAFVTSFYSEFGDEVQRQAEPAPGSRLSTHGPRLAAKPGRTLASFPFTGGQLDQSRVFFWADGGGTVWESTLSGRAVFDFTPDGRPWGYVDFVDSAELFVLDEAGLVASSAPLGAPLDSVEVRVDTLDRLWLGHFENGLVLDVYDEDGVQVDAFFVPGSQQPLVLEPRPDGGMLVGGLDGDSGWIIALSGTMDVLWSVAEESLAPVRDIAIDGAGHSVLATDNGVWKLDAAGALLWTNDFASVAGVVVLPSNEIVAATVGPDSIALLNP